MIFNFQKAYTILDELIMAGEIQESSKLRLLKNVRQSEDFELAEETSKLIEAGFGI